MIDSLYIGASGLVSHQKSVDTIGNNLANMNTTAYKKERVAFHELYQSELQRVDPATGTSTGPATPSGVSVGSVDRMFTEGEYVKSDSNLDVAIRGNGFFEVELPGGTSAFTRTGTFHVNNDRILVTSDGYPLKQQIAIPEGTTSVTIDPDGSVHAVVQGETTPEDIGTIELVQFTNPAALQPLGGGTYTASDAAGEPQTGKPGENGLGLLAQGFTESSNVKLVDELTMLMVAQRSYEASSKVVQTSDEILGMINNLRR
jgi:flagellar basal-body rod protein FlgG